MNTGARKLAYSIPETVAATGIGRSTIYKHIKAGTLRATRIGGRTVILAEHLTAWLNSFAESA
jgi:excisionase family DNA binding protein